MILIELSELEGRAKTAYISILTQKTAWKAVCRFLIYIFANLRGVSVYSIWYRRLSCAYLVSSIKLNSFSGTV